MLDVCIHMLVDNVHICVCDSNVSNLLEFDWVSALEETTDLCIMIIMIMIMIRIL